MTCNFTFFPNTITMNLRMPFVFSLPVFSSVESIISNKRRVSTTFLVNQKNAPCTHLFIWEKRKIQKLKWNNDQQIIKLLAMAASYKQHLPETRRIQLQCKTRKVGSSCLLFCVSCHWGRNYMLLLFPRRELNQYVHQAALTHLRYHCNHIIDFLPKEIVKIERSI